MVVKVVKSISILDGILDCIIYFWVFLNRFNKIENICLKHKTKLGLYFIERWLVRIEPLHRPIAYFSVFHEFAGCFNFEKVGLAGTSGNREFHKTGKELIPKWIDSVQNNSLKFWILKILYYFAANARRLQFKIILRSTHVFSVSQILQMKIFIIHIM